MRRAEQLTYDYGHHLQSLESLKRLEALLVDYYHSADKSDFDGDKVIGLVREIAAYTAAALVTEAGATWARYTHPVDFSKRPGYAPRRGGKNLVSSLS